MVPSRRQQRPSRGAAVRRRACRASLASASPIRPAASSPAVAAMNTQRERALCASSRARMPPTRSTTPVTTTDARKTRRRWDACRFGNRPDRPHYGAKQSTRRAERERRTTPQPIAGNALGATHERERGHPARQRNGAIPEGHREAMAGFPIGGQPVGRPSRHRKAMADEPHLAQHGNHHGRHHENSSRPAAVSTLDAKIREHCGSREQCRALVQTDSRGARLKRAERQPRDHAQRAKRGKQRRGASNEFCTQPQVRRVHGGRSGQPVCR